MKKYISVILCLLLVMSSLSALSAFEDVNYEQYSWAFDSIDYLSKSGVINGYDDGTFRPNGNVTRAEFAKMLSLAFKLDGANDKYNDISDHWAYEYIKSASAAMYNPSESFNPDTMANRADIAYAAASVLNLEPDTSCFKKFTDSADVLKEMEANISAAVSAGIVVGYEDSTLRPNEPVSRAEAAVIIKRALDIKYNSQSAPSDEESENSPEHIYTLYPLKDLILVTSVSETSSIIDDEFAYRISYRISNDDKEYSSLLPANTQVMGTRADISQICAGDVLIIDTSFHGQIDYLYVLASFGNTVPSFDNIVTFGRGDEYAISCGKITNIETSSKSVTLTIDTRSGIKQETLKLNTEANVYSSWRTSRAWSFEKVRYTDYQLEDTYVLVRYTNGIATDVVISDIQR